MISYFPVCNISLSFLTIDSIFTVAPLYVAGAVGVIAFKISSFFLIISFAIKTLTRSSTDQLITDKGNNVRNWK